jgi:hypothetical protein
VAQASARADIEHQVRVRLAPMQAEVDRAQQAENLAHAERDAEVARTREARQELGDLGTRHESERVAHATTAERERAALDQLAALSARLAAAEAQLLQTEVRSRAETEAAHERATGAERRAAMEIETERTARGRAEKRADSLETRLETLKRASAQQGEEFVSMRTSLDHERRETDRLREANRSEIQQRQAAEVALLHAKLALGRAETQARTTEAAMTRLLPLIGERKAKRIPAAKRSAPKGT